MFKKFILTIAFTGTTLLSAMETNQEQYISKDYKLLCSDKVEVKISHEDLQHSRMFKNMLSDTITDNNPITIPKSSKEIHTILPCLSMLTKKEFNDIKLGIEELSLGKLIELNNIAQFFEIDVLKNSTDEILFDLRKSITLAIGKKLQNPKLLALCLQKSNVLKSLEESLPNLDSNDFLQTAELCSMLNELIEHARNNYSDADYLLDHNVIKPIPLSIEQFILLHAIYNVFKKNNTEKFNIQEKNNAEIYATFPQEYKQILKYHVFLNATDPITMNLKLGINKIAKVEDGLCKKLGYIHNWVITNAKRANHNIDLFAHNYPHTFLFACMSIGVLLDAKLVSPRIANQSRCLFNLTLDLIIKRPLSLSQIPACRKLADTIISNHFSACGWKPIETIGK